MPNSLKSRKKYGLMLSIVMLFGVFLWLMEDTSNALEQQKKVDAHLQVSVIEPTPETLPLYVEANGITQSRWLTDVTATVSGRVLTTGEKLYPGRLINKDSVLVTLQDTQYRAELEMARSRVAEAELHLAEMKKRQHVRKSVGETKTSFGRFEPHVKAASAQFRASEAALISAQQNLNDTRITAPFSAVIIGEQVSPGQWINAGDHLFTLASSDSLDIKVELSQKSWQRLGDIKIGQPVEVIAPNTEESESWTAHVRYLSPVMDSVTRQRSLVLEVKSPFSTAKTLLPDQQVKVRFNGIKQPYVVRAPASVLTEDGKVWSVTNGRLFLENIELLDEEIDHVLFRYSNKPEAKRKLVRYPLSSMLKGQEVAELVAVKGHTS